MIGGLRIWNYNKSAEDSIKGVKNVDVLLNGRIYWSGEIRKARGDLYRDYVTDIKLVPEIIYS